jgi:hypothetical protein
MNWNWHHFGHDVLLKIWDEFNLCTEHNVLCADEMEAEGCYYVSTPCVLSLTNTKHDVADVLRFSSTAQCEL